jgi:hypothetical protein
MMKIDFKKLVLKDLNGDSMYPQKIENNMFVDDLSKPVMTIADAITANLIREDQKATPTERFDNFRLALKIREAQGEVGFTLEELTLIKNKVGDNPQPLIVGRVWEVINNLGESVKEAK